MRLQSLLTSYILEKAAFCSQGVPGFPCHGVPGGSLAQHSLLPQEQELERPFPGTTSAAPGWAKTSVSTSCDIRPDLQGQLSLQEL